MQKLLLAAALALSPSLGVAGDEPKTPETKSSVERERANSGISVTFTRFSTSAKCLSIASGAMSGRPRSRAHSWRISLGTRKHTPPVSTLDPP